MRLNLTSAPPRPAPEVRGLHHLYSPEQVSWVLHRERARADRHRRKFSLVIFNAPQCGRPHATLLRIARVVLEHARTTDEVGYFDRESIAAILTDTGSKGAWLFARRVCDTCAVRNIVPTCSVYTYPTTWIPGQSTRDTFDDSNGSDFDSTDPADSTDQPGDRDQIVEVGTTLAQSLEPMFVKPMPLWKRSLDLLCATSGLILVSPLMLAIALLIRLTSPGPIIFKQRRAGLGGKPFDIYKFRTMVVDAESRKHSLRSLSEQDGPAFKMTFDPRVTLIGRLLRCTSLDELPQLLNVIRGEMSLVGPRPLPLDEQGAVDQWQRRRLDVTPGLTCIWQVEGRSRVTFDEWVRMDLDYIRNRNFTQDLSLLARTVPAVLLRKGAR